MVLLDRDPSRISPFDSLVFDCASGCELELGDMMSHGIVFSGNRVEVVDSRRNGIRYSLTKTFGHFSMHTKCVTLALSPSQKWISIVFFLDKYRKFGQILLASHN